MTNIHFSRLTEPTTAIAEAFTRWENDQQINYLARLNRNQADLNAFKEVTVASLAQRIQDTAIYLIYADQRLIGEMSYQIDPPLLLQHEANSAWIGITIGESQARGKGIGNQALDYLEQQIAAQGLKRIELGVFEFNQPAFALYTKRGYREIGRINEFTYWQERMWADIRMEKRF
ncbi:GNAT family N-acetyltransferase [Herpetosiphon llansteffanensis]|uniref:GNAT family N-acetyltransferase n=1 Tax=Herpetosiphon llansteffanensis TaxID=2094568 RepID=UPI000D7BCC1A|nr:GNAT family N-acetyltransferase [Herpetosiphon llansteffanensis]